MKSRFRKKPFKESNLRVLTKILDLMIRMTSFTIIYKNSQCSSWLITNVSSAKIAISEVKRIVLEPNRNNKNSSQRNWFVESVRVSTLKVERRHVLNTARNS